MACQTRSCPCGTNSQECHDPLFGETYCYPLADFWFLGCTGLGLVVLPAETQVEWAHQLPFVLSRQRRLLLYSQLRCQGQLDPNHRAWAITIAFEVSLLNTLCHAPVELKMLTCVKSGQGCRVYSIEWVSLEVSHFFWGRKWQTCNLLICWLHSGGVCSKGPSLRLQQGAKCILLHVDWSVPRAKWWISLKTSNGIHQMISHE